MQNQKLISFPSTLHLAGIILLLIAFQPHIGISQTSIEICNNGIDDDNDGAIDLNDSDCDCPYIQPLPIIPNPSFEEKICCPLQSARMSCELNWMQGTSATTDYINQCGFQGFGEVLAPLPFPDGDACIGFFNGYTLDNVRLPNWKEYFGICLDIPLLAGATYTFEYYVGFPKPPYNPGFSLNFFGSTDCENLPVIDPNQDLGCPSNDPNWVVLANKFVEGNGNWIKQKINITPTQDIYGFIIGPECKTVDREASAYYFFDHLTLIEQSQFEFDIQASGLLCAEDLAFSIANVKTFEYQWFKDGIALVGETNSRLSTQLEEGIYQVMITGDSIGCNLSKEYIHERPISYGQIAQTICTGQSFQFNNQTLEQSGIYFDTLKTVEDCDSILSLELNIVDGFRTPVEAKIFPQESYQVGSQSFTQAGEYEILLSSEAGCDSLIFLNLDIYDAFIPSAFTPNGDGINDIFTIMGSEDLLWVKEMNVFNRWGKLVFRGNDFRANDLNIGWNGRSSSKALPEGVYVFTASLVYDDGIARTVSGSITLIR